ncbi:RNA polymerase sigma factor [Streptomyces bryophytorum]|uniref:Uncharacterized protein n=1 Tax=Actinacidiphila bryophytorum TaxID=1436133 RepID=A0A9W4E5V9_9ACTN|nr:RNA polymerase sigma factor [Actinacidiphila bryophytorum]MBN6542673.1 RNA polymerase sigma factor [Actinacidiphila bryophytorum]CAG7617592.1 hypothetical protein SBRY_120041 [Actinacidiphila bryophytorum]
MRWRRGGAPEGPGDGDEALVRSARDPAAFEPLVALHSAALHGYLARRAPAVADDLLSEVWLRAFAGRAGFDPRRGTARTWLFGVARHVLAAYWRTSGPGPGGSLPEAGAADPWQAVDERLDAEAVAPLIRRTLQQLPPGERELLLLVVWEQLSPAEAAAALGIPAGTARSRLHRARAALREALTPVAAPQPRTDAVTATTSGDTA